MSSMAVDARFTASYDAQHRKRKTPLTCAPRPDGRLACDLTIATTDPAGPQLSSICRSTHSARYSSFLECRFKPSLCPGRGHGAVAIRSRPSKLRSLPRGFSDWLRLSLLPLGPERRHVVLGPAADTAHLHGNTRRCGRGACECKGRSHSAVAAACINGLQPLLWRWTDDLRLYGWVQFFPCIALPLLFVAFPARYSGTSYWLIAAAFYALAKLFEFYDQAIYSVGFIFSGHTLKHFAAASACFAILRYFQTRRPVLDPRLD